MWAPVLPLPEAEREVVAADLPGVGGSPVLPGGVEPTAAALVRAGAAFLDELGWDPPHVAGNSLGGWIALELARMGRARSVCALSPAGLWKRPENAFAQVSLIASRAAARPAAALPDRILARPQVRRAAFAQLVHRGDRIPPAAARQALLNLARSPGFGATLNALMGGRLTGTDAIAVPVTIAWAEHDRLLLRRQADRARAALPRGRHLTLAGCGHVPTWDDPRMVAAAILTSG